MKTQSLESILTGMATVYDARHSINPRITILNPYRLCHGRVALTIKKRGNVHDKMWFYGIDSRSVTHCVLTDSNNRVVQDTCHDKGVFLGQEGYASKKDVGNPEEYLLLISVVEVSEWLDEYFNFTTS